ncbi:MAG: two pore domain potassium channel family protein [Alistipes sp.]|nr:two pore domain potassium channel family protein [Alistipes sp.]
MHLIKVVAGVLLLVAFSWEILGERTPHLSTLYLRIQADVCLLFLLDFLIGWLLADSRHRYFWHHLLYLLFSIPWLNLVMWSGVDLPRSVAVVVSLMPLSLPVMAMYFLLEWIDEIRIHRLFFTYSVGMVLFTYLAALIFYEVEVGTNSGLHGFGDALWWAGVNLTTAGASLIPTTVVGKILSVLLPLAGMLFLPIFTTYVMQRYEQARPNRRPQKKPD